MSIDNYNTFGNRYIDVSSGGPAPFTWVGTSNVSWLTISPSSGSISASAPEQRVFFSVDWSKFSGSQTARIAITATPQGLNTQATHVIFTANHKSVSSGFHGAYRCFLAAVALTRPVLILDVPLGRAT